MSWIRKWKTSERNYTWRRTERACNRLAKSCTEYQPTLIVGLSRGGLIPAVMLANLLNIRHVYSLGLASYTVNDNGVVVTDEHDVYQPIPLECRGLTSTDNVLIVDDISDQGNTLNRAQQLLMEQHSVKSKTCTLVVKPGTSHLPNFYFETVAQDKWVNFPWEKVA